MKKNGTKITVLDPGGQPSGIFGRRAEALSALKMAPRLDSLEGKTVYLVDTGFAGGADFMQEVRDWFARNRPPVKTVLRHKKTSMFTDEPELWAEIKKNDDAVVFGVGGFGGSSFTFITDPLVARNLKSEGYDDPSKLSEWS